MGEGDVEARRGFKNSACMGGDKILMEFEYLREATSVLNRGSSKFGGRDLNMTRWSLG